MKTLTKEARILLGYMSILANTLDYEDDMSVKNIGLSFLRRKKGLLQEVLENPIDYALLSNAEKKLLGFKNFPNGENDNLIPLWIFRLLPEDTVLRSISGEVKEKKDADDDERSGCVAFCFDFEPK